MREFDVVYCIFSRGHRLIICLHRLVDEIHTMRVLWVYSEARSAAPNHAMEPLIYSSPRVECVDDNKSNQRRAVNVIHKSHEHWLENEDDYFASDSNSIMLRYNDANRDRRPR